MKTKFVISKKIALCLIVLCVLSTISLCFVNGTTKWLLMIGCIFSLTVLFGYIWVFKKNAVKVVTKVVEREVRISVSAEAKNVEDTQGALVEKNNADQRLSPVHEEKDLEISSLMRSLEDKHISTFESRLVKSLPNMTEEEQDALLEELVDIGLLAMDFVNINTRKVCSYADMTKDRIDKKIEKNDIIRQIDPTTRLSQGYRVLSRILQAKFPGKSFLYSGYKL